MKRGEVTYWKKIYIVVEEKESKYLNAMVKNLNEKIIKVQPIQIHTRCVDGFGSITEIEMIIKEEYSEDCLQAIESTFTKVDFIL